MKALWLVSFRPVGKSKVNDFYQNTFVESVKSIDYDITLSLTQFDEANVKSYVHNPLTIASEMLKLGLKCEGIYFYHFHAFPPIFEEIDPLYFRKISWKMEKPTDWRGYLLASAFIIDCKKI